MAASILPDDEVERFINIPIVRLATKLQRMMLRRILREAGLPVLEWRVMFYLADQGDMHLRGLTASGSLDAAHTSRAAAQLESKGLIKRHDDPSDHRRKLLSLTDAGRALVHNIWPEALALSDDALTGFSKAERAQLTDLLGRLHTNVDALMKDDTPPQQASQEDAA